MSVSLVFALTSVAALWLLAHKVVRRRFALLKIKLPDLYQSAIAVPPEEVVSPQVVALCIDLIRKENCTVDFHDLSPNERTIALHAVAVEALPVWMSKYAALSLSPTNRALMAQLRQVKSSRPQKPKLHFGAVKRQQQLRSSAE